MGRYAEGGVAYFARQDPIRAVVIPIVCLEIILTLGMFGFWEFCRRRRVDRALLLQFLFLAICLAPLGIASVAALRALPFNVTAVVRNPLFWPAILACSVVPLIFICRRVYSATRLVQGILLYSWPVLILILVQSARGTLLKYPQREYADGALSASYGSAPARIRVVWIIFDELSQTIAFGNRPSGLELSNLDRLKRDSFYGSSAVAPADSTEISMPSLILGQQVIEASPEGPDVLRVRTAFSNQTLSWTSMPNLFDRAHELGFNTALVGWFHPYGRLLNHSLTQCYWTAGWLSAGVEEPTNPEPLVSAIRDRLRLQLAALPLAGRLPAVSPLVNLRRQKIEQFSWLRDHAIQIVSDSAIGLALIHLPIPHPPAIYTRTGERFTAEGRIGYLDSVALVDQTLGQLRRAMEQAGLWERTAVLLSADHGWRTYHWRGNSEWNVEEEAASHQDTAGVPFLLKLPGQTSGMVYDQRFNTIVTRQLITGILSGQLTDAAAISGFIERHGQ